MRVFILGAGATGGLLAQILRRRGHEVVCGDADPARACSFIGPNVECRAANARDARGLARVAKGCELLINAVPAAHNETVLRAALRARAHYLDMAIHLDRNPFKAEQFRFSEEFVRRKRLALIGAGAAPGLTNLLVANCADALDQVDKVMIRLFEQVESRTPISTWSAEVAHDEATSKPRVYRRGNFRFARRFGAPEWFTFPPPIGRVRVVLAAQDEVGTLPYYVNMRELDVKIGGNEIERLRRWHRQGKLAPSDERSEKLFPKTASPTEVQELIRRGHLSNARFAACVVASGIKRKRPYEHRRCCTFPSLYQLRQKPCLTTPVAFAAAQSAAAFVEHFPTDIFGVLPPEALPKAVRHAILRSLRRRGLRLLSSRSELGVEGEIERTNTE